jgi:APA family basic amino acid/polyamine antiporter
MDAALASDRNSIPSGPAITPAPRPARTLGLWAAIALVVGNQLGVGVFTLPASLAPFGWNALVGWGASIAGALALACVFGRLAVAVPGSGGPYLYTRAAFGDRAGFVVAWSYWMNLWVGNAALPVACVGYLALFWPALATNRLLATGLAVAFVWLFTLVNLRGVAAVGRVAVLTTLIKLVPLIGAALLGIWVLASHGSTALTPAAVPLSGHGIAASALLTLFALLGMESASVPGGKVRNPARTIPRAALWGTAFSGVISFAVASAVMLMSDPSAVAVSGAPIADFAAHWAGGGWSRPLAAFAVVGGLGCLSGWLLLQGEVPAAMARAGVLPRALARVDARGTPVTAHLVSSSLLTFVLLMNASASLVGLFTFIVEMAVLASLVAYLTCSLAAIRLRAGGRGFAALALFAAVYSAWALTGADRKSLLWFGGLMLAGLPVYAIMRLRARADETSPARADGAAALQE